MVFLNADRLNCGPQEIRTASPKYYRTWNGISKQKSGEGSEVPSPLSQEVSVMFALYNNAILTLGASRGKITKV